MQITELHTRNFMGVECVDVTPDSSVVVIGGKNGAGKSSVINSILAALGGKGEIPPVPLRKGAANGSASVRINRPEGDIIVTRTFGPDGKTSLKVESSDGAAYKRPQEMLDQMMGAVGFDPYAFTRLDPKRQAEQLREMVGLDFSELDSERESLYAERTIANRQAKTLQARVDAMKQHADAPAEEVSVTDLLSELQKRQEHNREIRTLAQATDNACGRARSHAAHCESLEAQIADLQRQLVEERQMLADAQNEHEKLLGRLAEAKEQDTEEIRRQIEAAEDTNAKVRVNRERAAIAAQLQQQQDEADDLTRKIDAIDEEKRQQLADAPWPVPGLGFDAGGVTFNGLPFSQASSAEQLRVSLAMGMAFNPKLRVLIIRDGSLIDDDNMAVIREMVEERGFQVWVERVSADGKGCSLVIEEGRVAEVATA